MNEKQIKESIKKLIKENWRDFMNQGPHRVTNKLTRKIAKNLNPSVEFKKMVKPGEGFYFRVYERENLDQPELSGAGDFSANSTMSSWELVWDGVAESGKDAVESAGYSTKEWQNGLVRVKKYERYKHPKDREDFRFDTVVGK